MFGVAQRVVAARRETIHSLLGAALGLRLPAAGRRAAERRRAGAEGGKGVWSELRVWGGSVG